MAEINQWANFLANHKLTPKRVKHPAAIALLIQLCELLARKGSPKMRPYTARLQSRRLVCMTAMQAGIDLASMKHHGKMAMSRGLLDSWNQTYREAYLSTLGTAGAKEATRRDVKTKLAKERAKDELRLRK